VRRKTLTISKIKARHGFMLKIKKVGWVSLGLGHFAFKSRAREKEKYWELYI